MVISDDSPLRSARVVLFYVLAGVSWVAIHTLLDEHAPWWVLFLVAVAYGVAVRVVVGVPRTADAESIEPPPPASELPRDVPDLKLPASMPGGGRY